MIFPVTSVTFFWRSQLQCENRFDVPGQHLRWLATQKWTIIDGKRCLIKGGSGVTQQEPYNEVIASELMEKLNIPHVPYRIIMQGDYPYSVCEDFIDADTELISADYIMKSQKKANHLTTYQHYLNCCAAFGISNAQQAVDQMIVIDYLLANTDRHYNNFGAIRNANSLEWIGSAPIYDSGTSLWCNTPTKLIRPLASDLPSKPFKETHEEQLKLVSSFDWVNFEALQRFGNRVCEIFAESPYLDSERCVCLSSALDQRIERLEGLALTMRP
ncbi:MAG: HipA domain-containing protein [Hominenteromicrobium sp.]|uniref:HipA domain-containing protein n=1 Tax=Hominenteromicrobium sp. TaxID=3073581 RepID=UPI0039917D57